MGAGGFYEPKTNQGSAVSCLVDNRFVVSSLTTSANFSSSQNGYYIMATSYNEQYTLKPENPYVMPEILDAPLTEKGRQEAYLLQPRVQSMPNQPDLIVLSPNCRALQTGVIAFGHLLENNPKVPFIAHEMVREETGVHICDKRRPTSKQAKEFPMVDFSLLESEEDNIFMAERRETKMEIGERIYNFMEWLAKRPEKHIGIASHSGWLMTLFNGMLECDESLKLWFQTGEMRSVKLLFSQQ